MNSHDRHVAIVDRAADYADFDGLRILVPSGVYTPTNGPSHGCGTKGLRRKNIRRRRGNATSGDEA
jgi:hypothetical protein